MDAPIDLREQFRRRFGATPRLYRAPGRVNLIGEHTDYNGGYVLPLAIGFDTRVAAARDHGVLRVHSRNFGETVEFPLAAAAPRAPGEAPHWSDYVLGVARCLQAQGVALPGADLLIDGGVPLGAGLSSSAALEMACALALSDLSGQALDPVILAQVGQRAEHEFVGTRCGIMDQLASALGRKGHALLLDCRSLEHRLVPLEARLAQAPTGASQLVICNTMVHHALAGSEYNRRRAECERGVAELQRWVPGVTTLRDVTPLILQTHGERLDPLVLRRCRHVVAENERVLAAELALQRADPVALGALMRASHRSLRDDYEVSCAELDLLVRLALEIEGTYGARMTGGGFGGCTINLVRADAVDDFCARIGPRYEQATGLRPEIHVCASADGARRLDD